MNITITPGKLRGAIQAIPSKSQAHRALVCAAFADAPTAIALAGTNADMDATARCLNALGAEITRTAFGYQVNPASQVPERADLYPGESGSTLRFLLPVVGALGVDAPFHLEGRLGKRPLSPLREEMERMGCRLSQTDHHTLHCSGMLRSGDYRMAGNVSSQYFTGLLLAGPLMEGCRVEVTGILESRPYVDMTLDMLHTFGVKTEGMSIPAGSRFTSPGKLQIEGDWSNAAFFLTAAALGSPVTVTGLDPNSSQGDRTVVPLLKQLEQHCTISAADVPDLIPVLSIRAAAGEGAVFTDISRLRLKESDRVEAILHMIRSLGGRSEATQHTLTIHGTGLTGGTVDSRNDHRIAMAAAIAATVCRREVTILGAEAVNKSDPLFWEEYASLGGNYEQHLR